MSRPAAISEVALALKTTTPVVAVGSWDLPDVIAVGSAEEAVDRALAAVI